LDGSHLFRYIVENPAYPITPAELSVVPTSVVVLDPRTRIPYTVQYSIGIDQQITAKSTLSATYVGSRGIDLFRSVDTNAPTNGTGIRPNPDIGQRRDIQSAGDQKSHGFELTFRGKPSRFFNGQAQYTLSKTYNNTSGITYFPANSYDPGADRALADNDRRQKLDLLGSMPVEKYFTVGVALSLYSGKPVNVTTGSDNNHDGITNDRPSGIARNSMRGPGLISLDLNLAHDFVVSKSSKEPKTFTVALNAFNVLNHENDQTYVGVITSPFFGHAIAAQPPRRMQLDLQFKF
jgi:outer membrane receptor protein involved in Fe transport